MPDDATFMSRALALAALGRRTVSPNPMVGCVIVRDGEVVGEGWHRRAGEPHAEAVALRAAAQKARGAAAYISLEPCNHTGRTGPCTTALIDAGVTRVVAAVADPHPMAAGGADTLRAAGITVDTGVLGDQARRLNEVFFHGVQTQRPFVVAKVAASLDGRLAAADGTSQWLTGEAARRRVHELRAEVDAVLIGSGTVLADDPQLTCRLDEYRGPQPLRVVLDRRGRVTHEHRVNDAAAETVISHDSPADTLRTLWDRDVRSVLVEGGAAVLHAFLAAGLVDRLHVHVAPVLLGEQGRPLLAGPWTQTLSDAPRWNLENVERTGDDVLLSLSPEKPAADAFPQDH
ncbi:MAG: bifunctional diaminohydroxyphosphoribosylaminopyrimidine deaminase/5-amino-6-(5-phosphoribosylamino)uracil reductase RibD [Nitriliruptorales bacterium]|nr:bifunctional diaminohydroxyphosphoribosylaminopyrimidine deaminase/5-amino-6-(5-phosphoribosylamino)uracil reductase RibD [Nitriliruptorales bacterium]